MVLFLLLGCGGSGIGQKRVDAGHGSGADLPDAQVPRAPDAEIPRAPDAEIPRAPDAEIPRAPDAQVPRALDALISTDPEPSKDAGQSRGGDPADAEVTRGPDVLPIDVQPARSSMACVPGPAAETSLGRVPGYVGGPAVVSVSGQAVVVGNGPPWEADLTKLPKENLLWRTSYPQEPGTTLTLPSYYAGDLQLFGDNLLYTQVRLTPNADGGGWSYDYPQPALYDLQTDQLTKLPLVQGIANPQVRDLRAGPNGEIFGIVQDGWGDGALIRWAPKTYAASLIAWGNLRSLFRVGNAIYWVRRTFESPGVRFEFFSAPLTGAPVSVIHQWSGPFDGHEPDLLGVDRDSLYFSVYGDYEGGFLAVPLGGGVAKTVVPNVQSSAHLAISESYIYWAVFNDTTQLLRVRKQGGPIETIWNKPTRYVGNIVVDDCNVYWTVLNPAELFIRAH
jgi:hypothetical protein